MKKILLTLILIFSLFSPLVVLGSNCDIDLETISGSSIGNSLDDCLGDSNLVNGNDAEIEGGFKKRINKWTATIGSVLGIIAVGSIVYGAILLTLTAGEDEKVKKAKDIVKWGIIGFIGVISASTVITVVVNIMYSLDI